MNFFYFHTKKEKKESYGTIGALLSLIVLFIFDLWRTCHAVFLLYLFRLSLFKKAAEHGTFSSFNSNSIPLHSVQVIYNAASCSCGLGGGGGEGEGAVKVIRRTLYE